MCCWWALRGSSIHVVGVRRVPARVVSATFGRFCWFGFWGGGGGMIPCFRTSASPKRPSSTLSPSKPEALTPKTPNLESFSIPPTTFALFCVPEAAASMPDDENATFRNNYLTTTWSTWCEQVLKQPAPPWREQLPDVLKTQPCRCFLHVHHPFQCEQVVK